MNNYSYSRQIPGEPEGGESIIAQAVLFRGYIHACSLHKLQKIVNYIISDDLNFSYLQFCCFESNFFN